MSIHKEGYTIIFVVLLILAATNFAIIFFLKPNVFISTPLLVLSFVFFCLVIWFFRNPDRKITPSENVITCPADGKVVVIEKIFDKEYFNDERIQVSIFMSPLNIHVNRYPISGDVTYQKYYPGKYLVAWHPKSSELNERSSIVVEAANGKEILTKQIAGAVARRIVTYSKVGDKAVQGEDIGFIKFGSRVDLLLPLDTDIQVKIGDKVEGNNSIIGTW